MPRGTPDGNASPYGYASQETDPGSIYQMLWGFSPIDSQGRIIYLDTFNNGAGGWVKEASGAGATLPYISSPSSNVFSPPNVIILSPGNTSSSFVRITRNMYAGRTYRLGIETGFLFASVNSPDFQISIDYHPVGNLQLIGNVPKLGFLEYKQSITSWQIGIPPLTSSRQVIYQMDLSQSSGRSVLMQVKLVIDALSGKYVRALIGDQIIDLSQYDLQNASSSVQGFLQPHVMATSAGAGTVDINLGYVLLTKDEP